MLLVMAFLTIGVPYLLSIQQGDVSQAQVSVSLGGGFPQEHQVQAGMEQIKDTFQANFHNCQLLELHFDAVYSGGLQEELQERYGTEETKGLFVVTSTVVTGRLSPARGDEPRHHLRRRAMDLGRHRQRAYHRAGLGPLLGG